MTGVHQITPHLREVLAVLLDAHEKGEQPHGYAIMQRAHQSAAAVYPMLRRLMEEKWVEGDWVAPDGDKTLVHKRVFRLTASGIAIARTYPPGPAFSVPWRRPDRQDATP